MAKGCDPPSLNCSNHAPPVGGWLGWSQVLGCFFISICSLGLANTFGVFQAHYEDTTILSPSTISWIGTTQGFLLNILGLLSGRLHDLYPGQIRPLLLLGSALNVLGLLAASFSSTNVYPQAFLSLGVCVGIGSGLVYVPSLGVVTRSFDEKRRPFACGVAATGAGVGGVVYPILFRGVMDKGLGFAWAVRGFALVNLGLLGLACLLPVQTASRSLIDTTAFRDNPFILFSVSLFLLWLGVDVPFFFLPSYAKGKLGLSDQWGDHLLSIMNASAIVGRVFLGLTASVIHRHMGRYSSFMVWLFSIGLSSILLACWVAIGRSLAGIIVFVVLYGALTGGVISLVSSALLVICPDIRLVGTRLGMSGVLAGVGFLVGPPIAGATQDKTQAGYLGQSLFAAATYFGALVILGLAIYMYRRGETMARSNIPNQSQLELARVVVADLTER
ncbi:riboflavin transporter MCH5 protein [Naviculisporaceae sp. PSN 640]